MYDSTSAPFYNVKAVDMEATGNTGLPFHDSDKEQPPTEGENFTNAHASIVTQALPVNTDLAATHKSANVWLSLFNLSRH